MKNFKAVLFDLDGTLIDTAPDLANALNHVLISENKSPLSLSEIRPVASDGALGLLNLGFGIDNTNPKFEYLREKFVRYYKDHIEENSALFNGIENFLSNLEKKNISWGIVTNKPTHLTEKLLKKLNLFDRSAYTVCGDTLPERKPHPAPIIHAVKKLNLSIEDCCYVGDAERDIQAAKAANMYSIAALYGYINKSAEPKLWNADAYVYSPDELAEFIKF
jgi:2-phosphoglycolate phosphatase